MKMEDEKLIYISLQDLMEIHAELHKKFGEKHVVPNKKRLTDYMDRMMPILSPSHGKTASLYEIAAGYKNKHIRKILSKIQFNQSGESTHLSS